MAFSQPFTPGDRAEVERWVLDDRLDPILRPCDGGQQRDATRLVHRALSCRRMCDTLAERARRVDGIVVDQEQPFAVVAQAFTNRSEFA